MARTRAVDYDQRREIIMEKAAQLFAKEGFSAGSVAKLAGACDISKSIIYHYYGSKEDVLYEVMASHIERLNDDVSFALSSEGGPLHRLRTLLHRFMRHCVDTSSRQAVLLNELDSLPADKRQVIVEKQRHLVDAVQALLSAIHPALAENPMRARVHTMLLFSMINGTHTWFDPSGPMTPDDVAEMVLERMEQPLSLQ